MRETEPHVAEPVCSEVPPRDADLATILVVDDDPTVTRLVERSLVGEARVLQEFGLPEAGTVDFDGVDLVVLDYQMPVRDGFEVLAEIRERAPELPVIFLTGFGDPEIAERALRMGADRFLTKPVGPSQIRATVQEVRSGGKGDESAEIRARSPALEESLPPAETSREFRAVGADGDVLEGRVIRFRSQTAVVELEKAVGEVTGRELDHVSFKFGRQRVTAGVGIVAGCEPLSSTTVEARVVIPDVWDVVEEETASVPDPASTRRGRFSERHVEASADGVDRGRAVADETIARSRELSTLPVGFRLAVHELAAFLREVRREANRFSRGVGEDGGIERLRAETEYVLDTVQALSGPFWELVSAFETAAREIEENGLAERAKPFARKELYPLILCSPFLARIVERPIGVPGDYGMLGQILGNPLEGHAIYDRVVNSWILNSGAARAYRYRVNLLEREIRRTVERRGNDGNEASVLSMASGVAYEVQHYLQDPVPERRADFTLVDFSTDTLEEARRQYATLGRLPDGVSLQFHRSSVIDLANRSRGIPVDGIGDFEPRSDYDHIYCAGLFDYLSDRLISRVTHYLHGLLAPGGRLVVSNYTPGNPLKGLMTLVLDWELIYRTEAEFSALMSRAVPDGSLQMESDEDGAEIYALIGRGKQ